MVASMPRKRYIHKKTTVTVDASVLEELKRLKRWKGEPLNNVVKRLIEHYKRTSLLYGY
jgi:predicted CopG family antitoxin